ncbi:hypothetical protein LTR86_002430 [Recurvomyces mirabilis]|nr:hypothetical protein LTR86_002430 [Recurvomyces mirabilis]
MSNPFIAALIQAETNRKVVHQQCITARQEILKTYNSAYPAVARREQLGHDTPTNGRKVSSLTELCRRDADLSVEQLLKAARIAKDILHAREKQYKLACATEAEARQDLDNYRLDQGKLQHFEPNTTASGTKGPIQLWREQVNAAFDDYDNMTSFPAPPPHPEGTKHSLSCRSRPRWRQKALDDRPIPACDCAVRAAFLGSMRSKEETISLKTERLRWDPDLFPGALRAQARISLRYSWEAEAMPAHISTAYLVRLTRDANDLEKALATAQSDVVEARARHKRCERMKEKLSKQRQAEEARMRTRSGPNSMSTPYDDLCHSILGLHLSNAEAEDACKKASQELKNATMSLDAIRTKLFQANLALSDYQKSQSSAEEAKDREKIGAEAAEKEREEDKKFRRWIEAEARKTRERQEAEERLAQERDRAFAESERQDRERRDRERRDRERRDRERRDRERQDREREAKARESEARGREAREREAKAREAKARKESTRREQQRRAKVKATLEAAQQKSSTPTKLPPKRIAVITKQNIAAFFTAFEAVPIDRSTLKAFPEPPSEPCKQLTCKASAADRKLEACSCNIKKVFFGVKNIKAMRNRFHPDKSARCPEEVRELMQKKAEEISVVLSVMI